MNKSITIKYRPDNSMVYKQSIMGMVWAVAGGVPAKAIKYRKPQVSDVVISGGRIQHGRREIP